MSLNEKRTNIDLMRCVLMAMVVATHYLLLNHALPATGSSPSSRQVLGMGIEAFCLVDVNGFMILSGFLRARSAFRTSRFAELLMTALFYGCGIYLAAYAAGVVPDGSLFGFIQAMMPVSAGHYWFMTSFLILFLLSPFLNAGAAALSEKTLRTVLALLLTWSCLIKSVVPVNLVIDDMGYGLQWMICLYLTGVYLRLHVWEAADGQISAFALFIRKHAKHGFAVYVICELFVTAYSVLLHRVNASTGRFAYYAGVPLHINFLPHYIAAAAFFIWMMQLSLPAGFFAKVCAFLAPHALGVYLFHAHPVWFSHWTSFTARITGPSPDHNAVLFVLHLLCTVLIVFAAGVIADMVRDGLFRVCGRMLPGEKKKD